jgi:Type III pantothenate kinase
VFDKKTTLAKLIPPSLHELLFGSVNFTNKSAATYRLSLRVPILHVYVVSTNVQNEALLLALFKGIPALLYKLGTNDLLLSTNATYPGMGVDRMVNISAAKYLYPEAKSVLVIDGGTAMTYTTIVPAAETTDTPETAAGASVPPKPLASAPPPVPPHASSTNPLLSPSNNSATSTTTTVATTNSNATGRTAATTPSRSNTTSTTLPRLQMAGGIGPGLRLKLQSLHDYTDDLPLVDSDMVQQIVSQASSEEKPLSLFIDKRPILDETVNDLFVARAMVGSALTEMSFLLCSIVRGWLDKVAAQHASSSKASCQELPIVVVTGGDGPIYHSLLQPKHSFICQTNAANVALLEGGLTMPDADELGVAAAAAAQSAENDVGAKTFRLQEHAYLPHIGVQRVLALHRISTDTATTTNSSSAQADGGHNATVEQIRNLLIGQRVAVCGPKQPSKIVYGIIGEVQRGPGPVDEDYFSVVYDDTCLIDDLRVHQIYGTCKD